MLVSNCPGIRILDTRKTIPGLRLEQKYAVRVAGGSNQRLGLYDAYLLKENHLAVLGGISSAVTQARAQSQDAGAAGRGRKLWSNCKRRSIVR